MWLVLCSSDDTSALWACEGLKIRGLEPLELVRVETLAYARWEYRLGAAGVHVSVSLPDGRRISNDDVHGVLNRFSYVPPESVLLIHPSDRQYVIQELNAFFLSWLDGLPQPVLNQPTPQGLSGHYRDVSEWIWLASKAGLPTLNYRQSSRDPVPETSVKAGIFPVGTPINNVLVVDGHITGVPAPVYIQNGCRRLADLSKTKLLGIEFCASAESPWTFAGATTLPDLTVGGEALLDALATVFKNGLEKRE